MSDLFKVLGIALAIYVLHAIRIGKVFAKSGASGQTVSREDSPGYFWTVVVIYAGLSLALVTVF